MDALFNHRAGLTLPRDVLLSNMGAHVRRQIRLASEKCGSSYECDMDGSPDSVVRFAKYYDRRAELKNLPRASTERMAILARHKALAVSFVRDTTGEILAAGTYLVTPRRVRNLQAAAAFRATSDPKRRRTIAHANRYLYWRDILRFQEAGAHIFDFGGWYSGNDDAEKLRVNDFKEEFGGQIVPGFNGERAITTKGKLALYTIRRRTSIFERKRRAPIDA